MSVQATLGRTLPERPVVRLTDALTFALYGVVAGGGPHAHAYLPGGLDTAKWIDGNTDTVTRIEMAGGLLHGLDAEAATAREADFYRALVKAAAEGAVIFCGLRQGGPFTTDPASERIGADPIPKLFFASPVEISIESGRIDLHFEKLGEEDRASIERLAATDYRGEDDDFRGWSAVGVEREGFITWLASYQGKSVAAGGAVAVESAALVEVLPKNRGGRPVHSDQALFIKEMIRIVGLDGGNLTKTELKKKMKEWATKTLSNPPDDRTMERWVDKYLSSGILTD